MKEHTFTLWLQNELTSARCALLKLYEKRDELQYIDGPRLEKEYMDAVGNYEETVIKEEIECELLEKKKKMIQAAINRREPVDEAAIDAELNAERQKMLNDAAGSAPTEYALLSAAQSDELQELYRDIVKNFHPQMHPELTEAHRQLFQKAQDAYRRRDLEALKLIHEMLYSTEDGGLSLELMLGLMVSDEVNDNENENGGVGRISDYSVAAQIYGSFRPTAEEAVMRDELENYRRIMDGVMDEMAQLRSEFPYNAADMLSDPDKIQAYKDELAHRLRTAAAERERRTREIGEMLKEVAVSG